MSTLAYEIVDVFTARPYAGNPLAVVFGAEGLATEQMQALAREFNLSETVFVLPATQVGVTYRARIFTPVEELPFAGHPSVGAAVTASRRGLFEPGQVTQECGAGVLPIEVTESGATLTGGMPTLGPELDPEPLLEMAGLAAGDHVGPAPRVAGCGLEFPFLPVRPEALARAQVDPLAARRYGIEHVSVFSWDAATQTAYARVFVPGLGVPEDPATGSAALGLGVWLVASGLLPADERSSYTVRQGVEMGRPSSLACTVTAAGGTVLGATVSGQVMAVAKGEILVPPFVG
ncbi:MULTISPECIES: PhzF family phenazine biosynthesis protein [Micromonospora]|uniref:Phenazine biosynthesis protein PhzF n=1 Tax=Micromonospora maris TaxID=1003110 RepID=A0A9X0LFA2_9ACTN|nr:MULTISPECIES: PhzF family phenazine biosynthesis protein [Micromonospora]AEB42743.1 phenazine biosynthesis protein phzf family [Micromonospora maris AB-18-032]KUJ48165.1 phenazine biosynthesis protein PhzF [Micromonospora maris]RUL92560.1 PhzF family phenazine biosynthesis protein [Verrucosispora sp. FIM060022]